MAIRSLPAIREWIGRYSLPRYVSGPLWKARTWERSDLLHYAVLVVVLAVAVSVRVWDLNRFGFNTDEAVYMGQGAAIARVPILTDIFPVFRAHPLLFQFLLALLANIHMSDVGARLLAVAVGIGTVFLTYRLGKLLYGRNVGLMAGLIMAIMPYHVIVSRQVLLDGPLVFCATLTFYMLARYAIHEQPIWLHATGICLGLTFLAKETGIILIGAIYAFLALSNEINVRFKDLLISLFLMVLMILPFPLSLWLAGGSNVSQQYIVWQLFRRPNHPWSFYLTNVPGEIGWLVVILALLGFWLLRSERTWRERLLFWWILIPVVFFQIWPTKGFQYLLPIAPAMAILASRTLLRWSPQNEIAYLGKAINMTWARTVCIALVLLSLALSSWDAIKPSTSGTFIAGTGGLPGGREAGQWIHNNIPENATLLTIGPSMANILQFYGYRQAFGLSVSPNPLRRNPSYEPVLNPDLLIRTNEIQYIVWDSYSAARTPYFSESLLNLAQRFNGVIIHAESIMVPGEEGTMVPKPVIVIYKVHP